MSLPIAMLLLIITVAAFAEDPPVNQGKEFVDFEDTDDVAKTASKGVTNVPIITATPILIEGSLSTSKSSTEGLPTTISTTGAPTTTHSSTSATTTTDSSTAHSTTNESTTDDSTTNDSTTEESNTTDSATDSSTTALETTDSTTSSTTTKSTTSPSTTDSTTNDSTETTTVPTTSSPTPGSNPTSSSSTDSTKSDFKTKDITASADSITTSLEKSRLRSRLSLPTKHSTTIGSTTDSTSTPVSPTTEQPTEEERILALRAQNSEALALFNTQLDAVSRINWKIDAELDNQAEYLASIEAIEKLLQIQAQELLPWEAELLRGVVTSIQKIDLFANRSIETVSELVRLQELNQDRVRNLGVKLNVTQGLILRSAKGLDDRLNFVNQLLLRYIEPKVNSLRDSVASLNISQVYSEIELKNVPEVRNLTETSITKLSALKSQLAMFNQTQGNRFYSLEESIKAWIPTNFNAIRDLAHTLSISQKRTDLAIAIGGSPDSNANKGIEDINQSRKTTSPQISGGEYEALESSWKVVAPVKIN
ncbi:agglutinin-like protein 5 [Drosophila erecta]|uniref:GG18728 n=1 Tax=Drosophila erecta TaxID=7220 RepID=B3P1E0_DROER|nr:agglutinin-like protein 5 [Drosophila erecta]EDV49399.1 uncharacterized protein Dere_GG18728 [Drosophila erecta]